MAPIGRLLRSRRSLDVLGQQEGTDKASRFVSRGSGGPKVSAGHGYLDFYEAGLRRLRKPPSVVLDLGVGPSRSEYASARMWRRKFPRARVIAIDIREDIGQPPRNVELLLGDLSDKSFRRRLASLDPDLVVDDASHMWADQLGTLRDLLPALREGGLYILEDLHTSSAEMASRYGGHGVPAPARVLAGCAEALAGAFKTSERAEFCDPTAQEIMAMVPSLCTEIWFHRGAALLFRGEH